MLMLCQQDKNVDADEQETAFHSILSVSCMYGSLLEGFHDWDSKVFNSIPIDNRFVVAKICSLPRAFLL